MNTDNHVNAVSAVLLRSRGPG